MENLINEMLSKKIIAVVGVSRHKEKYGYKVWRYLKDKGYKAYPVNPNAQEIDGEKCYPNLSSLPEVPEVVNFVVPPNVTVKVLDEVRKLGIKYVWFQPGSESEEAIDFCKRNGIKEVHGVCMMMESEKRVPKVVFDL